MAGYSMSGVGDGSTGNAGSVVTVPLREQLLDAAQAVILEQGIGTLTLDKVAAKASVSKGGLLHHFPSKDALVGAIVRRVVDAWQSDLREAIGAQAPGPLRVPRAMLNGCISKPEEWTETLRNASICVIAAMSEHPKHVEPCREVYAELEETMRADGTPAGLAQLIVCAMDGLWMSFVFGTRAFSRERLDAMSGCLAQVVAMHEDKSDNRRKSDARGGAIRAKGAREKAKTAKR